MPCTSMREAPANGAVVKEEDIGEVLGRDHSPVKIIVKARKVDDWRAEDGVANPVPLLRSRPTNRKKRSR